MGGNYCPQRKAKQRTKWWRKEEEFEEDEDLSDDEDEDESGDQDEGEDMVQDEGENIQEEEEEIV